jgi:hypothetical protein
MLTQECTYLITPLRAFVMKTRAGPRRTEERLACEPFCTDCPVGTQGTRRHTFKKKVKDQGRERRGKRKKVIT